MSAESHLLLSTHEQQLVTQAIQEAEKLTSGEIRLFIEEECDEEVLERAAYIFEQLEIHRTEQRNGVLFYLAVDSRKFAILGDSGINRVVAPDFWDSIKTNMKDHFKQGEFAKGLCQGIIMAGEALKNYFPYLAGDKNELPDDIVFGGIK